MKTRTYYSPIIMHNHSITSDAMLPKPSLLGHFLLGNTSTNWKHKCTTRNCNCLHLV